MDIKDRIKQLMDYEQMTAAAFAEKIGVAPATISHTLGDRNKYPSTDFIMRLHESFEYISLNWLLTGNGEMLMNNNENNEENPSNRTDDSKNRKDFGLDQQQNTSKSIVQQNIIYKETDIRRITEIRVFFDDNTYEIFKPEK
jgi:transcriptional regulator with XRE-family HTH domain